MKTSKKILSLILTVALVSSINWGYFTQLLNLTKSAAIELVTGGSVAGAALVAELNDLSISKFFEFNIDDFLVNLFDEIIHDDSEDNTTTDDVINKSNEIGHKLRNAGANDQGVPGRYNASHAEKQLSIISDNPIGISQPMCTDCQGYFKNLAIGEGREYVTADPNFIRIFSPDGVVTEIKR